MVYVCAYLIDDEEDFVKKKLQEGETIFDLDFSRCTVNIKSLESLFKGFQETNLSNPLTITLNLRNGGINDQGVIILFDELAKVQWPGQSKIEINLGANYLDDEGTQHLFDVCRRLQQNSSQLKLSIDLTDNGSLGCSIIDYALDVLEEAKVEDDNIITQDGGILIQLGGDLVEAWQQSDLEYSL